MSNSELAAALVVGSVELAPGMLALLEEALVLAQGFFQLFAQDEAFGRKSALAFGEAADLSGLRTDWLVGEFSVLGSVELRSGGELSGALGAYAASLDRIYSPGASKAEGMWSRLERRSWKRQNIELGILE